MARPARLNGFRCKFPVVVLPNRANALGNLSSLHQIVSMGRYISLFKSKSYSTSINEGTTIEIISGKNFVILRVVLSTIPEIRYDGWYQNHICTVRFCFDISRAQILKSTYSNSWVWRAGLVMAFMVWIYLTMILRVRTNNAGMKSVVSWGNISYPNSSNWEKIPPPFFPDLFNTVGRRKLRSNPSCARPTQWNVN